MSWLEETGRIYVVGAIVNKASWSLEISGVHRALVEFGVWTKGLKDRRRMKRKRKIITHYRKLE